MTVLPLIDRELRVAARQPAAYRLRFLSALGVFLIWFGLFIISRHAGPAQLSRELFTAVGVLALIFSLLAGVFLTSDCLSQEKREGTLGLLFLTDLKAYDIVLAKVVAHSIHAVYALVAVFPVLGLPLLMGGVSVGEFWRVVLVVLVSLLLSLALGTCVSVISREAREAMTGTFFGLLVLAGILPAIWWLLYALGGTRGWDPLFWPSPVYTFRAAFDFCYGTSSGRYEFWASLILISVLGAAFLILATILLPRAWQENGRTVASRIRAWPFGARLVGQSRQNKFRLQMLEANPFLWLATREPLSNRLGFRSIGVLVVLGLCFLIAALSGTRNKEAFVGCLFTAYAIHQVFKYAVAVEATRRLSLDRQSGALELLLVTPLREAEVLRGQVRALRRQFAGMRLITVLVNLCLCAAVVFFAGPLSMGRTDRAIFCELFIGGLLMVWFDFSALEWTGVWMALQTKHHNRAILATLGRVLLVPWAAVFCLIFFMSQAGNLTSSAVAFLFACWFILGMLNALILRGIARARLARGIKACLFEARPSGKRSGILPGRPFYLGRAEAHAR